MLAPVYFIPPLLRLSLLFFSPFFLSFLSLPLVLSGADIVMLDNMNPSTLKVTTTTIQDKNGDKNGGVLKVPESCLVLSSFKEALEETPSIMLVSSNFTNQAINNQQSTKTLTMTQTTMTQTTTTTTTITNKGGCSSVEETFSARARWSIWRHHAGHAARILWRKRGRDLKGKPDAGSSSTLSSTSTAGLYIEIWLLKSDEGSWSYMWSVCRWLLVVSWK